MLNKKCKLIDNLGIYLKNNKFSKKKKKYNRHKFW